METREIRLATAKKIIQHMESEFPSATLWLFSAIKHYLLLNNEATLTDFKKQLERLCPNTVEASARITKSKENMKYLDEYNTKVTPSQIEKMKSFYDLNSATTNS